jgi:lipopolysaccharide export system protein LptA
MIKSILTLISLSSVFAKEPQNPPLRIVADNMDCDQNQGICIATGNAFAERPHDPERRTIRAHKFTVHFLKTEKGKASTQGETSSTELKELHADGHVVMTDSNTIIRCNRAIYHHVSEDVELFDNVHITQGENQLNGSYGYADLKSKKYRVTNKEDQVQGLFVKKTQSK